jgi:8-oxo-dGTP pyrophosphatase MutT (NUDIX family)
LKAEGDFVLLRRDEIPLTYNPKRVKRMKEISAGGLVYRILEDELQIQLIQDRYGKITLPKGKMEAGETVEQTALREIFEETGIIGQIMEPIALICYQFVHPKAGQIDKEVHYYLVKAIGGTIQAQVAEIRGVEWLTPKEAWRQQKNAGYSNNDNIVRNAYQLLGLEVD